MAFGRTGAGGRCVVTTDSCCKFGASFLSIIESASPADAAKAIAASTRLKGCAGALVRMIGRCEDAGLSVFFFGSEARVVYALRDKVAAGFPGLTIAGICDADFGGPVSREILEHIDQTLPDVVITDMAMADYVAFARVHGERFFPARVVNFPGAFRTYALPASAKPWIERAPIGRRLRGFLEEGSSAGRFSAIVLGQLLRSLLPALRFSRVSETTRRNR